MSESFNNLNEEKSNTYSSSQALNFSKMFIIFILTIMALFLFFIVDKHYFNHQKIKTEVWAQSQMDIKNKISEKKKLRKNINSAFLNIRLMRKYIKDLADQSLPKAIDIEVKNKDQKAVLELVNIFYQSKLVFGVDVSNIILDFVKLADSNANIYNENSYDAELRKFQHKANVLMENSIINDRILRKEFMAKGP